MKTTLAFALGFSLPLSLSTAAAQSEVVGICYDGLFRHAYSSTATDFVGDWWVNPSSVSQLYHAMDFNAEATELYAIRYIGGDYGILDELTGDFTSLGISGLPPLKTHGITAHPDGSTWFAIAKTVTGSQLYRGTMGPGTWTPVGPDIAGLTFWDIACDSTGALYAHSVSTDSLYSIDPDTAAATLIGPLGYDVEYSQGFDFDWVDDTLYATISIWVGAGGGSKFTSIDTATGAVTVLAETTSLYTQAEMAIKSPAPCDPTGTLFCDPAEVNSVGLTTKISGCFNHWGDSGLHLEAFDGPPGEFGYFLVGTAKFGPGVMVSEGRLCLSTAVGDSIGRYNVGGGALNSIGQFDAAGVMQNLVGTSTVGSGFDVPGTLPFIGSPTIVVGDTWYFQYWHRDVPFGGGVSNFSSGLEVLFL